MNTAGLLPWQPAAAEQLEAALEGLEHSAADLSDMGTGKTFTAGAVLRSRDVPTLIVCPSVSVSSWRRMGEALGVEFSILNYEMLRTGRTDFGDWEHPKPARMPKRFKCDSCQMEFKLEELTRRDRPCPHHFLGIHCIKTETATHDYGKFKWHPNIKRLVFDEVHRCGALDSLHADMLIAAKRQRVATLGLSATAAENPLDLRAFGYVLGLHGLIKGQARPSFFSWAAARGCRKVAWAGGGFQFLPSAERRKQILLQLHQEIIPSRGCRVRIADLGDSFPEVQITSELYDLSGTDRIQQLYAAMDDAIASLNVARTLDKCAEHPLTVLLRARQEVELLTVPVYEELVADALAQGLHVAIFVNFRATVDELCKRLKTTCRVDGSQRGEKGLRERMRNVERFQDDKEPVIVLSEAAGGVSISLHDVLGKYQRLGLVAPGISAVRFRQVFGRLRRATGKSKALYRIILIANTVQEKLHKAMAGKLDNLDLINDGDLWASNLPITAGNISDIFHPDVDN